MADTLGTDLSEVASWGVVGGTIRSELREGKEAARQVANLTLFGPKAKLDIERDDVPVVQVLKELARAYASCQTDGDFATAHRHLNTISNTLSAHEGRRGTRMEAAIKLLVEQAKFQVKMVMHGGEAHTSADLEAILADQDATAIRDAIEAKAEAVERDEG